MTDISDTPDTIEAKRIRAAAKYPTHLTDSMGRNHRNVPHHAIMSGQWDKGWVVQNA